VNDSAVISMRGVTVSHPRTPKVPLVSGVEWQVRPGECWVVTGVQGSGKTALLETAAGLFPCLAGEVRVFGEPMENPARASRIRRRVGLVFDGHGRLFPRMTVYENVALPVTYHDDMSLADAAPWVNPVLEALELDRIADVPAGRLGRAWARRVAIARALALRPELLLMDNPVTGLDAVNLRWWRGFAAKWLAGHPLSGGKPATLVLASDEVRPLLSLGHRFAVVNAGTWRVLGDRAAFEDADEPLLRELLAGVE
jgi:ABC-type transporter Mla maintaining outer membrane lipid asymmetry ATPase subunit MlaF